MEEDVEALTQVEMANRIGISQGYLADIEHNRKNVSLAVVLRIAEGLGISVNKLINGDIKQQQHQVYICTHQLK
ncbi:helix-turn-helix transcriptional regulator [Staphylococcus pseudoxylosus]|uniref:helix-turn-helix domain-containing protein n=1 Tax=Staphylococcus pseudoxylosus TaxID=2282419 RepID=UPI00398B19ED